jgi:hypothetical protein
MTAPSDITVTSPACEDLCTVDRSRDFEVRWTGGGAGYVAVELETSIPDRSAKIVCLFEAAGGHATVPAALLSMLDVVGPPTGEPTSDIRVVPYAQTDIVAGGYAVRFAAVGTSWRPAMETR